MRPKIGYIIEIPLSRGKKAYGQYVFWDDKRGPLLQIYDLIIDSTSHVELENIVKAKPLFPPVITGLFAAIRTGLWKVVGNMPVKGFKYPGFISTFWNEKTGEAGVWYLWNGVESIRLGDQLPEEYKNLEFGVVWSPYDVADRIETGVYPYPYGDLIRFNKYTPRNP